MKSSLSNWHYVVSVKLTVKISSIFVAFLENTNFKINISTQIHWLQNCKIETFWLSNLFLRSLAPLKKSSSFGQPCMFVMYPTPILPENATSLIDYFFMGWVSRDLGQETKATQCFLKYHSHMYNITANLHNAREKQMWVRYYLKIFTNAFFKLN